MWLLNKVYSVPVSCAYMVLNDFHYWVNWHNLSPPNLCINVSPFCHPKAGSLHPECSQLVPPKTPNPPKSLWTINSSQGYDSFLLLRIQACFLSILDKPSVWGCFHPFYRPLILSWKTRPPFVPLLSVHSVLGEAANKSPVGDRRWPLQTTSHPPHHPCHDGHTLNLSLRLNLVRCLVTTTWKAIEHCPMAHLRLASQIFHYKFK